MTDFTASSRGLPYPLSRAVQLVVTTPAGEEVCGLPEFPEDSDERITVLFRLSLNEFVALASAVDAGVDPAYGADAQKVWWIWVASVMCASFCEEMALCLSTENPVVVESLSQLLENNSTIIQSMINGLQSAGFPQPGLPMSEQQHQTDALPPNTKDGETCLLDELWGGCLYLVQSGNRTITDVFEQLEAASNTLERADIAGKQIPVLGQYVADLPEFADQLESEIAEGYAAAYTEEYEESLACALFCIAQDNCTLSVDDLITVINERLPDPLDVSTWTTFMAAFFTGVFAGEDIANFAFLLYFMALKFGQQFGDTIGLRPLTTIMGLGADVLASDNWSTLCDCGWESVLDFTISDYGFTQIDTGVWADGIGWEDSFFQTGNGYRSVTIELPLAAAANITYAEMTFEYTAGTLDSSGDYTAAVYSEVPDFLIGVLTPTQPVSPEQGEGDYTFNTIRCNLVCGILLGTGDPGGTCTITQLVLRGFGDKPSELP